jgi:hypothetical protein
MPAGFLGFLTMLPGQLDLFQSTTTAPSTGLSGVQLRLPSPCNCGSGIVTIGSSKAMHNAAIRCSECGVHRGWLSRAEVEHLAAIVGESGRPTEPIDIGSAR